jgi:hypothetical protein
MNTDQYSFEFWRDYSFFTDSIITTSGVPSKIDYSHLIYRARFYDGFDIDDINELTYLKKEKCTKTGRANVPYHPVFYGSYSKECAIAELKLKEGGKVVLSEWKWNSDIELVVKLFSKSEVNYESSLKKYNIRTVSQYKELAKSKRGPLTPGSLHGDMITRMEAFSDVFLSDDYFGSATLAFNELYRSRITKNDLPPSDLLIYHSKEYPGGVNLAIHPEVVDNFLDFICFSVNYV